jgi:hypothetical protein
MAGGGGGEHGAVLRRLRLNREFVWCAAALVVAVGFELVVARFIRSKGVDLTGDEPSYIIQAQAYLHLSPHILSTIRADLGAHSLTAYPPGAPVSAVASFTGSRGMISPFEPGLGLLLAPFVASGRLFLGAVIGMLVLNTAGLILIHRRVTQLTGLGRRGQVVLAMVFLGPAMLLAVTQIYPDLISGVLLACALVELAIIERTGRVTWFSSIVVGACAVSLPWFQVKNFLPAIVLVVAYAFAVRRSQSVSTWRASEVLLAVALVSWALLLTYNVLYFGHLLGLPEPGPGLNQKGVEYTLGLLFDRHQGLFVQMPFAVIGLIGLWLVRRRLPVAVVATVLSVFAILVLNGAYVANPYGGTSLAGRFMWTAMPSLIAWTAIVLARFQDAGRLLRGPAIVVVGAWVYQAIPILAGDHSYYNLFTQAPPWNPASWPGWWPGFNRVLPQFDLPGHPLGAPAFALPVELALAGLLVIAASRYMGPRILSRVSMAGVGVLALVVVVALVVASPLSPNPTRQFSQAQVGAPVVGGDRPASSPVIPLQGVPAGTFRLTLSYRLGGPVASGRFVISCNPANATATNSAAASLRQGDRTTSVAIRCLQPGAIDTRLSVSPRSDLNVRSLQLKEIAV